MSICASSIAGVLSKSKDDWERERHELRAVINSSSTMLENAEKSREDLKHKLWELEQGIHSMIEECVEWEQDCHLQ